MISGMIRAGIASLAVEAILREACSLFPGKIVLQGHEIADDHQADPHQHARNGPGQEEPADGDAGGRTVDDKENAGRDDRTDGGRGGGDRGGKSPGVSPFRHRGDKRHARGRGIGGGGTVKPPP